MALFVVLALFYGRKIPQNIHENQTGRISTVANVGIINGYQDDKLYYYEPYNKSLNEGDLAVRSCYCYYIQSLIAWYRNDKDLQVENLSDFDGSEGIWIVYDDDNENFISAYPNVEYMGFKIGNLSFYRVVRADEQLKAENFSASDGKSY